MIKTVSETAPVEAGSNVVESVEQCRHLQAELDQARSQIDALNEELTETNKGVIALYAELDDKAAQLRHISELKSRFLSYMSHEFRVPLGAIRSIARILLDRMDGPLTNEQQKQVGLIQSSAIELTEMVDDLLDLAKVEAGRITISPAWFEMVDLFSALRGMFKPILSNLPVSLVFEEPVNLPRVYSDDKKLSQILRNLISNALKFTMEGKVTVSATRVGPDKVRFSVWDTGIGISPEHVQSLFQEFVQVDSKHQKRLRGVGLGLALCKKFAELLGGEVSVVSEVGVGSTFSLEIPLQLPAAAPDGQSSAENLGSRPKG